MRKETKLYLQHGYKWDIYIKYYITISESDTENILKVNDKVIDNDLTVLKRETKIIKIFNKYIYFNKVYGGK